MSTSMTYEDVAAADAAYRAKITGNPDLLPQPYQDPLQRFAEWGIKFGLKSLFRLFLLGSVGVAPLALEAGHAYAQNTDFDVFGAKKRDDKVEKTAATILGPSIGDLWSGDTKDKFFFAISEMSDFGVGSAPEYVGLKAIDDLQKATKKISTPFDFGMVPTPFNKR